MLKQIKFLSKKSIFLLALSSSLFTSAIGIEGLIKKNVANATGLGLEFQWDADPNFKRLKYYQSSKDKLDRATYYLFLRPRERKTAILKLTVKIPDYFNAKIRTRNLTMCEVLVGGYQDRTRCLNEIPSVFEINKDQTKIEIFPDLPIPSDKKSYALKMKIFNPRSPGMFQFHALSQSPGDLPISEYLGTWTIDIR